MYCLLPNVSLSLTRGDTYKLELPLYEGTGIERTKYIPKETDTLYVGLLECNQAFEDAILRKKLNYDDNVVANNFVLDLAHEDTDNLLTGKYFLTAKLVTATEDVYTVLPLVEFWLVGTDKKGRIL